MDYVINWLLIGTIRTVVIEIYGIRLMLQVRVGLLVLFLRELVFSGWDAEMTLRSHDTVDATNVESRVRGMGLVVSFDILAV